MLNLSTVELVTREFICRNKFIYYFVIMQLNSVFFCFHRKFDTGTWSIAVATTTTVLFSAVFVIALSYVAPKCACPQVWEHIQILPASYIVLYVFMLIYLLAQIVASILVVYGSFKAQRNKLPPFIALMVCTEIATFAGSIIVFVQLSKFDEYLLFDNDTYWQMAKMVLKEDLMVSIESMIDLMANVVKQLLQIDMTESLNMDTLMNAALKDGVLIILGGMKRMMNLTIILLAIGINAFFVTSILVVASHFNNLKKGTVKTYTGVPGMVIQKVVLSESARSTMSETLSDWSGAPLKEIHKMKSKSYKRSDPYAQKFYDLNKLEVQEKFPREDFL